MFEDQMKIAYIGIDLFLPALEYLMKRCEIAEIFTCKTDNLTEFNTGVIECAKKNGVPYTTSRITAEDVKRLKEKSCDFAICAGYYYKIPTDTDLPLVNIHPSLLPFGRGPWPMPLDILYKREKSGVTINKMDDGFDTGDILLQREFALSDGENLETFMKKACSLLPEMLDELLSDFPRLYREAKPQGSGEYVNMPSEDMYTIFPTTPYETAERILRAFYGYDCYYVSKDRKYRLIRAKAAEGDGGEGTFPVKGGYITSERTDLV